MIGDEVGILVGHSVGDEVGILVGHSVGDEVGILVGHCVELDVGNEDGVEEGNDRVVVDVVGTEEG
jgi:hypothetical protein